MKARILLVEDEESIVLVLKKRLEHTGYEVITASDGQQGLDMARSDHPDLILMDVMLPKMEGFKVCRLLKYDDKYKSIPIIILTALGRQIDVDLGQDVGADAYMTKPFESQDLLRLIEDLLKKYSKQAQ